MKNTIKSTRRNFIAMDLCTKRQFRCKVQENKKKKIEKFNLGRELRKYESPHQAGFFVDAHTG